MRTKESEQFIKELAKIRKELAEIKLALKSESDRKNYVPGYFPCGDQKIMVGHYPLRGLDKKHDIKEL